MRIVSGKETKKTKIIALISGTISFRGAVVAFGLISIRLYKDINMLVEDSEKNIYPPIMDFFISGLEKYF